MLSDAQKASIYYQAYVKLGDLAYEISCAEDVGTPCDELYNQAYYLTALIQALALDNNGLDLEQEDKIYYQLQVLSEAFTFPLAPSILNPDVFPSGITVPIFGGGGGTGGGGGPNIVQVFQFVDIPTRDADTQAQSPALAYVVNAQADPLIGRPSWALYYLTPVGWVLTSSQYDVLYETDLADTLAMPADVGGILAGTTVAQVKRRSMSSILDDLLFPTVIPTVATPKSASLVAAPPTLIFEAGTAIQPTLTATFNPGVIQNGDGSTGPNLVGNASQFEYTGLVPGGTVTQPATGNVNNLAFATSVNVPEGSSSWQVLIDHLAGTGVYLDNKNNPSVVLDAQRAAGQVQATIANIQGRRPYFSQVGRVSPPTTSAEVRGLTGVTGLLNAGRTGTFNITIPAGQTRIDFAVPSGQTVVVNFVESSNADVTSSFTVAQVQVVDPAGNAINYDVYSSTLAGTGYLNNGTYKVTIS